MNCLLGYGRIVLVTLLFVLTACGPSRPQFSQTASGAIPIGQFRGYEAMSNLIRQRLLDPDAASTDTFELGIFLGTRDSSGLPALMGAFSGDGPDNAYRSGVPNAMNTAIWYIVAQRIARQMSYYCTDAAPVFGVDYRLADAVMALTQSFCQWPQTSDLELSAYWQQVVGAFAPESEKSAFIEFMGSLRGESSVNGEAALKTATEIIFLNPYFLLKN